jgi:hypothetical protein
MPKIDVKYATRGACSMHKKELDVEGYVVSIEGGFIEDSFVCWKGLKQLLDLKTPTRPSASPQRGSQAQPAPVRNGQEVTDAS